ncbi:MAG TPA: amino acid adenylation domain-containing protein, partial [Telluria sp.]|nr:amino acid adenylation domain-containing protein [Telluria sp.]
VACSRLPLLPASERSRVLEDFNATAAHYPRDALLHQLVEVQAARTPDAAALVSAHGRMTYAALNERANRLAHHLRGLGVGPESLVGLCVERGPDMVVGLLAVLKAGGAYVPLDPALPQERLDFMLADTGAAVVLAQESLADRFGRCTAVLLDRDAAWQAAPATNPPCVATPDNLAYVMYTSGSTGRPKAVAARHEGAVNYVSFVVRQYGVGAADRVLQIPTFAFDASVRDIVGTLSSGASLHLLTPDEAKDPAAIARRLAADGITALLSITPSLLDAVTAATVPGAARLRLALVSGEVLKEAHVNAARAAFGDGLSLVNQYGPTECTMTSTFFPVEPGQPVCVGKPIANMQVYVLDDAMAPVPPGIVGSIHIGGVGLARGYLNQEDLTAQAFVAHPFQPGARLYRTGDLGRWREDGKLEYLGRADFQVKLRGMRVELGEIEACLTACAGVRAAVVLAREDQPGDQRLVAYVVAADGAAPDAAGLRAELSASLADYMIPSAFVMLDALPLTPNGKVDRKALPAPDLSALVRAYEAPKGAVETAVAAIWQELLGVDRIGRNDNFFELGGHSLLATRMVSRLRQTLGREVALRDLFEHPLLHAFAQCAAQAPGAGLLPVAPVPRMDGMPLSLAQQRLWFLQQLDAAAGAAYHLPAALRLEGALDRWALESALSALVDRHEALRTTFAQEAGEPVQRIHPAGAEFDLPCDDLSAYPAPERAEHAERLQREEATAPFDLTRRPLIRARLLRLGALEHILLLTQHHIVSDGWSIGVMVRELSALYAAFSQGERSPLAPLAVQYADYAVWQRTWLQGAALESQLGFWRGHLAGAPALLELPLDRPRP